MKKQTKLILAITGFISLCTSAYAGQEGRGGRVIVCKSGGKTTYETLDLWEARETKGLQVDLPGKNYTEKVSLLIDRLERLDVISAADFRKSLSVFHEERQVMPTGKNGLIPDVDFATEIPKNCKTYQAVRQIIRPIPFEKRYLIDAFLWGKLDELNRAVLVFHELAVKKELASPHAEFYFERSDAVRNYVGIVTSNRLATLSGEEYVAVYNSTVTGSSGLKSRLLSPIASIRDGGIDWGLLFSGLDNGRPVAPPNWNGGRVQSGSVSMTALGQVSLPLADAPAELPVIYGGFNHWAYIKTSVPFGWKMERKSEGGFAAELLGDFRIPELNDLRQTGVLFFRGLSFKEFSIARFSVGKHAFPAHISEDLKVWRHSGPISPGPYGNDWTTIMDIKNVEVGGAMAFVTFFPAKLPSTSPWHSKITAVRAQDSNQSYVLEYVKPGKYFLKNFDGVFLLEKGQKNRMVSVFGDAVLSLDATGKLQVDWTRKVYECSLEGDYLSPRSREITAEGCRFY